ncbi:hypothetical protein [Cystobacter fuscus]|uniref:hypothetical protein n=1 Tax=Cystobacter fuscus TaxID=43 RepID=UPI0037C0DDA0
MGWDSGLPTVERRLALAYAGGARLTLSSENARTRVTVTLPRASPLTGLTT